MKNHNVLFAEEEDIILELSSVRQRLKQMDAAYQNCSIGISIVDKNGKILRTNPAMMRLYQLSAEEYVGKTMSDLVRTGIFNTSVTLRVIASGQPVTIAQEISTGTKCLTTGVPVFDANGDLELIVVSSYDVTELYALKEQLKRSQKMEEYYHVELADIRIALMQEADIVIRSKKMLDLLDLARHLANVDSTVLVMGESGVGKELIATVLHKASPRRSNHAFVKINCGAIPAELVESELFGYEQGAFTGAVREGKAGLFELADGGSIFLDEIAELPFSLQVKLLRVLQEREFTRVGGSKTIRVNVRVIAATNKDLSELVQTGKFRKDLYYRLKVVPLTVPPLRERKEDIMALAQHYVRHFNRKYDLDKVISGELLSVMEAYDWPGNVRELINIVERMVVTTKENLLRADCFSVDTLRNNADGVCHDMAFEETNMQKVTDRVEGSLIRDVLKKTGNTIAAAKLLGVSRATLARKMRKYGIKMR